MNKKRLVSMLLVSAMTAALFTGCGSDGNQTSGDGTTSAGTNTLHPDNVAAGPASYGLTDSLGRVHGDAQFAGSSSVPAHVEMMGLIGMGNNPMVGATVACAVAAAQANA